MSQFILAGATFEQKFGNGMIDAHQLANNHRLHDGLSVPQVISLAPISVLWGAGSHGMRGKNSDVFPPAHNKNRPCC